MRRAEPSISGSEYPEVQLYGRTKDGKSIVLTSTQFAPYFYTENRKEVLRKLARREEVRKVETTTLETTGQEVKRVLKVWTGLPGHVKGLRRDLEYDGITCYAADIVFGLRFMYDLDIGACVKVTGKWLGDQRYIIDTIEDTEPFDPPLIILSFDIEASPVDGHILCLCWVAKFPDGTRETGEISDPHDDDRNILRQFNEVVSRIDPDVITGYNIHGYDFVKMEERGQLFGIKVALGRDYANIRCYYDREGNVDKWVTQGRLLVDTWKVVKQEKYVGSQGGKGEAWTRQPHEDLQTISTLMGFDGKKDVDASNIDEEWEQDREKVIEYCLHDAELTLDIFERLGAVEKAVSMAGLTRQPLERCFVARSSWLIDPILIREADKAGWLVPCNRYGKKQEEDKKDKITGAYVKEPEPGLHEWVVSIDYKSMYPSIIIAKNICFTTYTNKQGNVTRSPFLEKCNTHAHYLLREEKEGILPRILRGLMADRAHAKKMLRETGDMYWDRLQESIKILMNSFFGILASTFYRFTMRELGESITTWAAEETVALVDNLEGEGIAVIIADTDSSYLKTPAKRPQDAVAWGELVAQRYSTEYLTLEVEKVFETFFTHGAKKRYAGKVVWPEEYTYVRGYEMRRGDSFPFQRAVLEAFLDRVLRKETDEACLMARKAIQGMAAGEVEPDQLVIVKSCRAENQYKSQKVADGLPQVKAARKLKALGFPWIPGHKVAWVVTNGKTPQQVEPWIEGRAVEPDYNYYAQRLLNTLSPLAEVFGYDRRALILDHKASTLDDYGVFE